MRPQHARQFSRRWFLREVTLAGTAGLLGLPPTTVVAEPPPETTRV
jgi:NitT/TauT family transport system substrate-binding protein